MVSGNLYRTRYVIWDNFCLTKEDKNLTSYQLSAEVLGRLGITTGTMNGFHQFCRDDAEYRLELRMVQYDVLYGQKYLYDGGQSPYAPTEMAMGAEPITIRSLSCRNGVWYVSGENFSPYCKVTVGGDLLKTVYMSPTLLQVLEDPETENLEELSISVVDQHKEILSDTE